LRATGRSELPKKKERPKSLPAEIISAVLNSPIGTTLNDKLREFWGLPMQDISSKIKEEAKGVTEKIRDMKAAPYRVLGVDPSAEEQVVKAAYKAKAKLFHPDHGGSQDKMADINQAYKTICEERGWKP